MSKRGKALNKEMKERIKQLANRLIDSIDIDTLTSNQRANMLKTVLPYLLPKELSIKGEFINEGIADYNGLPLIKPHQSNTLLLPNGY